MWKQNINNNDIRGQGSNSFQNWIFWVNLLKYRSAENPNNCASLVLQQYWQCYVPLISTTSTGICFSRIRNNSRL